MTKFTRVVLAGGGTGGSVTPLLALAEELRRRHPAIELTFIGGASGPEHSLTKSAGVRLRPIPSGKLRRYFSLATIPDIFRIVGGIVRAWQLLGELKPQVVVVAGSYVAVPVVWAATWRRIPIVVHQQDVIIGLANRIMSATTKHITTVFPPLPGDFSGRAVTVIGNLVRTSLRQGNAARARAVFSLDSSPLVVCVGGGTGAQSLNGLFNQAAPAWFDQAQCLQITGPGRAKATPVHPRFHAVPFVTGEMADLLAAADVVVTRAGMGMLSELAALSKAVVVVPLPGTHQEANAARLAQSSAVAQWNQSESVERLRTIVRELLASEARRQQLGAALHRALPTAGAPALADYLEQRVLA